MSTLQDNKYDKFNVGNYIFKILNFFESEGYI